MCIQHLQLWCKISSDLSVHVGVGLEREREGREDCGWQNSEHGGRDKKWLGPLVAEVMVYAAWPRVIYPCSPFLAVSRSLSLSLSFPLSLFPPPLLSTEAIKTVQHLGLPLTAHPGLGSPEMHTLYPTHTDAQAMKHAEILFFYFFNKESMYLCWSNQSFCLLFQCHLYKIINFCISVFLSRPLSR